MKTKQNKIILEFFNGKEWVFCGNYVTEWAAWAALGDDNKGYRTKSSKGDILNTETIL